MLRESEFFKNRKIRILLCIELLFLLIGIAGLFGKTGVVVGAEDTDRLLTEGVSLPAGVYTARLYYTIEGDTSSSFGVRVENAGYKTLLSNDVPLFCGGTVGECRFYLLNSVDSLKIEAGEDGAENLMVQGLEIVTGTEGSRVFLFWVILCSTLINGVAVLYLYNKKSPLPMMKQIAIFGVPALALIASLPVMVDYNIMGADLVFHLMRIQALTEHLRQGEFLSRIESVWLAGHGYANSVFYGDTFLLIPSLLQLLGFSINSVYRLFVVIVNLATAWIAYVSFSKCFQDRKIGMLGCALYTLAPYRLYNIYNRAAVGEYTAMIFLPLLVWGFYRIYHEDPEEKGYLWNWVIPVIGFSGVIQSHVLTCEMVGGCVILLCLLLWKRTFRKKTFTVLAMTVGMTILVNAWFLVPFLDLMMSDRFYFGNNANVLIQNRGVLPAQLFYTLQAAGASSRFAETGMIETEPIGVGGTILLCLLLWIVLLLRYRKGMLSVEQRAERKAGNVAFLLGIIVLGMSTCYFPWNFLSTHSGVLATLVGSLQFPTRLTGIATICMVFTACVMGVWALRDAYHPVSGKTVIVGIVLLACVYGSYQVNDVLMSKDSFIRLYSPQGMGHSAVLGAEYVPLDAKLEHVTSYHDPVPGEGVTLISYSKSGLSAQAYVENASMEAENSYVEFPLLYYKGYMAEITDTGQKLTVAKGDNTDVRVTIPAGFTGEIQVRYAGMWYWHLATAVSILTCAGFLGRYIINRYRKERRKS